MKRRAPLNELATRALLYVLLCGAPAWAQSPKIVGPEKVEPYKQVRLELTGDYDSAVWDVEPAEAADGEQFGARGERFMFTGPPGRYVVKGITLKGNKLGKARLVVVIGKAPPPGPDPCPDPDPEPSDPLTKALQTAYAAEADPAKADQKGKLAALYRQSADLAGSDLSIDTWGRLFQVMQSAAGTLGVKGKLPSVQKVIQGELTKTLPTMSASPLDTAGRELAAKTFRQVAAGLEAVK